MAEAEMTRREAEEFIASALKGRRRRRLIYPLPAAEQAEELHVLAAGHLRWAAAGDPTS